MADSVSVVAGCAGLISTIETLLSSVYVFVRTCRDSRRDLDKVSRELQSLQSVLQLMQEDAEDEAKPSTFPPAIGQHVSGIVSNCDSIVLQIQSCITEYAESDSRHKTKPAWTPTRQEDVEKLRMNLEAHKSALELALDISALTSTKDVEDDTTETTIKDDAAQILEEIDRLESQLSGEAIAPNNSVLRVFLSEMRDHVNGTPQALPVVARDNSVPHLEVPGSASAEAQDGSIFSPDEVREFFEQQDGLREFLEHQDDQPSTSASLPPPLPRRPQSQQSQPHRERSIEVDDNPTAGSDVVENRDSTRNQSHQSTRDENADDAGKMKDIFYAATRKANKRRSPQPVKLVCNKPTTDSAGMHAKLFYGNLAVDYPLPEDVIALDPAAPSQAGYDPSDSNNEFTHWRFTAVTCPPAEFPSQNYLLRPMLFARPRPIRTVLSFRLDPSEHSSDFFDRLYLIRNSMETLQAILNFTRDPRDPSSATRVPISTNVWKQIVVHIHGPMSWKGLDDTIRKCLEALGIRNEFNPPLKSLDGQVLEPPYEADATELQGKEVHCTIRECSSRLTPVLRSYLSVRSERIKHFEAGTPIQIISTGTARGQEPQNTQRDYTEWVTALGELLNPNLVIDMTKFREMSSEKRFFLWKSMAYKGQLETKAEFVDSGLKVIDIAGLRKQFQKLEKEKRKASKDAQKER